LLIMDIEVNQKLLSLPEQSTLADALSAFGARPPFAVAVNGEFVARGQHAARTLSSGDRIDVVHPVAGG
jgi:sulfur carrier protein